MSPVRVIKTGLIFEKDKATVFEDQHRTIELGGVYNKRAAIDGDENGGNVVILEGGPGTGIPENQLANFPLKDGSHVPIHGHRFEGISNSNWDNKYLPTNVKGNLGWTKAYRPVTQREEDAYLERQRRELAASSRSRR